jgi:pilus assembly protein CpaB
MARSASTIATGRVNRRFLALALILGLLFAVLTYITYSGSGGDDGGTTSSRLSVVFAKDLIPAGTRIEESMVEVRPIPGNLVGEGALTSLEGAVGQVAKFDIVAGDHLLQSQLVDTTVPSNTALSYVIEEGSRGMAMQTNAVIGAGGLVLPGDRIDVLFVPGDSERQLEADHIGAMLIAENVEVLAVQQTIVDIAPTAPGEEQEEETTGAGDAVDAGDPETTNDRTRASDAETNADAATLTLLVTPEQAQQIFCAEASGTLRLMLHAFGDESPTGLPPAVCTLEAGDQAPIPQ